MPKQRLISDIAAEIRRKWEKVNYAAVPYLDAMDKLSTIDQQYGQDSAREIVLYFLGNAKTFRGPDAVRLKQELKDLLNKKKDAV